MTAPDAALLGPVASLLQSKGLTVLGYRTVPGEGVELLVRIRPEQNPIWNLLALHTMSKEPGLLVRFNRTLLLRNDKILESGALQVWPLRGSMEAALQVLTRTLTSAPKPRPREITEYDLPHSQFYQPKPGQTGGVFSHTNTFIPPIFANTPTGVKREDPS